MTVSSQRVDIHDVKQPDLVSTSTTGGPGIRPGFDLHRAFAMWASAASHSDRSQRELAPIFIGRGHNWRSMRR